jgi:hypothetical protein
LLFAVVLSAAEKVASSPVVQVALLEPFHQALPPVQLTWPPVEEVPAEPQVMFAASAFQAEVRVILQKLNQLIMRLI